jgi:hypothetical protein
MPGVTVRVMRHRTRSERRLTGRQWADRRQRDVRVWGLMPGEDYVNAIARGGGGGGPFGGPGGPGGFGGRGGVGTRPRRRADQEQINYAPTAPASRQWPRPSRSTSA